MSKKWRTFAKGLMKIGIVDCRAQRDCDNQQKNASASDVRRTIMATNYILYIGYDCGVAAVSVWPSVAAVEANLGGLTADLLRPGDPFPPPDAVRFATGLEELGIVDCRIIACATNSDTIVWYAPFRGRDADAAFQSLIDDGSIVPHPDGRQRLNESTGRMEPAYITAERAAELVKKRGG
jgi:hypothetical protein